MTGCKPGCKPGSQPTAWKRWTRRLTIPAAILAGGLAFAQTGDEYLTDREGVPTWDNDKENPDDVFTFVRIKYPSYGRRWNGWSTDYPASDLYMSYRLQQLTSLKVNPNPKVLELTDPNLLDYPFIYVIEPGDMALSDDEVKALRRYLLGGGFMMVDDFWGEREWDNFYQEIKRVFPDREPVELDISHPIFSAVFPLKEKPQVPSIHAFRGGLRYERFDAQNVHYRALYDDHGRMMAIICHNTDLGDGWEREAEDPEYFRTYSEPKSYPMGINIIFYAMTH
jgi:hypothetical protein